jgi:hypothetical protein
MADRKFPDYEALFRRAEEERRWAEERQKQAEERQKQAEERQKQAEEQQKQAEDREKQEKARNQPTSFREFVQACHNSLSRALEVGTPSRSTKGKIPPPTGKYCPTRLHLWSDFPVRQQEIYNAVYTYLQPTERDAPRLFAPLAELHGLGRRFSRRQLRSEKDLESYERFAVEDHVHDIIAELCKIPHAQERFRLGNGVMFDNHANTLEEAEDDAETVDTSSSQHPRPDQFCVHRVDGTTNTLLTTVEHKPPHKLSIENLRVGLRSMDFWDEVVQRDTIPTDKDEKLKYNAEQLTGSVLVQEYHVMIQEGLEYSYITNGLALVLLRIPYDDPSTLYYYLCEPNMDVNVEDPEVFQQPKTAIARVLCLCLMSFYSSIRDQAWRNDARSHLHIWKTSFDYTRSRIPNDELQQAPPDSEYTSSEYTGSEYLPSSPLQPTEQARRISTRSRADCASMDTTLQRELMDSSPPTQRSSARPTDPSSPRSGRYRQNTARFCTQRCLLGLQQRGPFDDLCPNVHHHRQGQDGDRHRINAEQLVQLLKRQLDQDLDHYCTPFGVRGSYGAPFKITCAAYGYTVVGKGTTSRLWKEVSREAKIYQILRKAQGSAVPVFLGAIDLELIYFLHGAGEIRHMLLMA